MLQNTSLKNVHTSWGCFIVFFVWSKWGENGQGCKGEVHQMVQWWDHMGVKQHVYIQVHLFIKHCITLWNIWFSKQCLTIRYLYLCKYMHITNLYIPVSFLHNRILLFAFLIVIMIINNHLCCHVLHIVPLLVTLRWYWDYFKLYILTLFIYLIKYLYITYDTLRCFYNTQWFLYIPPYI